jgi:hypothetical protein
MTSYLTKYGMILSFTRLLLESFWNHSAAKRAVSPASIPEYPTCAFLRKMSQTVMTKKQMITKVPVFVIVTQRMDKTPATMSALPFPAFQAKKISDVARAQLEKDQVEDIEDVIDDLLQFLLKGEEDIERLKRFFLILYLRRAHETFKLNERMAEGLKNKLQQFRSMIDKAYEPFSGSFSCPHKIDLANNWPFQELVITQDKPELTVQASKVPANYCREVKCSSAITVACRSKEQLADLGAPETKLFQIILPMLSMGSFAKLFFICEEFVSKLDVAAKDTNLTVCSLPQ